MDIDKIKKFVLECNPTVDPSSVDRWISRATNLQFGRKRKRRALGRILKACGATHKAAFCQSHTAHDWQTLFRLWEDYDAHHIGGYVLSIKQDSKQEPFYTSPLTELVRAVYDEGYGDMPKTRANEGSDKCSFVSGCCICSASCCARYSNCNKNK